MESLLSEDATEHLRGLIGQHVPILASVSALEDRGFNAIPDAFASALSGRFGWPMDEGELRQTSRVSHTRARGWHRLVTQAEFGGSVTSGASYVLVDDHVGFGGTLAIMRGYVEQRGGKVLAMTTLTETTRARTIAVKQETLGQLRSKHGSELERLWQDNFGYGLECCTEIEAGYVCRQNTLDGIRGCLAKAAKKARQRGIAAVEL